MRGWTWFLAVWCLFNGLILWLFPEHVLSYVALQRYTHISVTVGPYLVGGTFVMGGVVCAVAAWLARPWLTFGALSLCLTLTCCWVAVLLLTAIVGLEDYGRIVIWLFWLVLQANSLRYIWIRPIDELAMRRLVRSLRAERRALERRTKP